GLGPRLRLTAFLGAGILAAPLMSMAIGRLSRATRVAILAGVAVGLVVGRAHRIPEGLMRARPDLLVAVARCAQLGPGTLIIPDRQLVFATVWFTRRDARLRPEPVPAEQRIRIIPDWMMTP